MLPNTTTAREGKESRSPSSSLVVNVIYQVVFQGFHRLLYPSRGMRRDRTLKLCGKGAVVVALRNGLDGVFLFPRNCWRRRPANLLENVALTTEREQLLDGWSTADIMKLSRIHQWRPIMNVSGSMLLYHCR